MRVKSGGFDIANLCLTARLTIARPCPLRPLFCTAHTAPGGWCWPFWPCACSCGPAKPLQPILARPWSMALGAMIFAALKIPRAGPPHPAGAVHQRALPRLQRGRQQAPTPFSGRCIERYSAAQCAPQQRWPKPTFDHARGCARRPRPHQPCHPTRLWQQPPRCHQE